MKFTPRTYLLTYLHYTRTVCVQGNFIFIVLAGFGLAEASASVAVLLGMCVYMSYNVNM